MAVFDDYLSLVRRMSGLEFLPQAPEGWAELAKVLRARSKNQEHAGRIVSRFLEPGAPARCPTPGELAMMAKSVAVDPRLDRPELAPACEECAPFGGTHHYARNGVERCVCARGRTLRALDAARAGGVV
jgi:hypothetical protein